ncbi:hypothetical protein OYC64_004137 [Pagothenia borchgrevinki]|uniref:Uncharacterized protein n=1 Tax=Pagothenia borchgrevinki TaxID=8213 RepID=A0ABD2FWX1_PAGBO
MTPLPATPVRSEVKNLETERNQMKSSSKRDILDGDDLEVNAKADETEPPTLLVSSPLKRSRKQQTLTANEKVKEGSTEKSANKPSPPSTRSSARKDGERSRVSTGEDTFKGDSRSAMEAGTSGQKARRTRRYNRLPSKYKDFILCQTRRLDTGRTPRRGRKIGN